MKLFVWNDPYSVSYGSSLVFAVAKDVDAARKIAATAPMYAYGQYEKRRGCTITLGEPLRVIDIGRAGVAEWHEWSE